MVTQASELMLRLFPHFKKSLMPFSGGLLEQSNRFIESMQIIESNIQE